MEIADVTIRYSLFHMHLLLMAILVSDMVLKWLFVECVLLTSICPNLIHQVIVHLLDRGLLVGYLLLTIVYSTLICPNISLRRMLCDGEVLRTHLDRRGIAVSLARTTTWFVRDKIVLYA